MQQQLAHYRIEKTLGEGSFAWVYRAYDEKFEQYVALKVLKTKWLDDPNAIARFKREARTIRKLRHPHIIDVYDVGELEGQVYLAQLLIDGETLAHRLIRGPLAWNEVIQIVTQIGSALDYAHSQGVIHRDIKPQNILLGPGNQAYLGDFGLIRAVEGSTHLSSTTSMIGTAHYMAPEIWDGKKAVSATDVYALSCVVFEMLTGKVLFEGSSMAAVTKQHIVGPQFPERWPDDVPARVTRILRHGLVENPNERISSGGELAQRLQALDPLVKPTPPPVIEARTLPISKDQPPWKWVGIGLAALIIVLAAIYFIGGPNDDEMNTSTEATLVALAATATAQMETGVAINSQVVETVKPINTTTTPPTPINALISPTSTETPTSTPVSSKPTKTPTKTPFPPTRTRTPTPIPSPPTPTKTPLPPTRTPLPPTPTRTPLPPTQTPITNAAPSISDEEAEQGWASSGHAASSEEAFVHWNNDDPPQIPESCAKCHSTPGFLDAIGADGTAAGVVNRAASIGTVIECDACHNEATSVMSSVVMPSGIRISNLGPEVVCMQCHQGRYSAVRVNEDLADKGDEDTINEDLWFQNIHYYAAAATLYGAEAMGGYQYDEKSYQAKYEHVEDFNVCVDCHNSHTLQVRLEACNECHEGVTSKNDVKNIRTQDSLIDYDGDGNASEGLYYEIEGLREMLDRAIQTYANAVTGKSIVYDTHNYPYFFVDTNSNRRPDGDEVSSDNRYNAWTPRLLKAAYNYQVSSKDPGAYVHNGKYIIQLLYDSIEDLNSTLANPINLSDSNRPG